MTTLIIEKDGINDDGKQKFKQVAVSRREYKSNYFIGASRKLLKLAKDNSQDSKIYSTSSIIQSAFFLEAFINELILDVHEGNGNYSHQSHWEIDNWNSFVNQIQKGFDEKMPIMKKFKFLFLAATGDNMKLGDPVVQNPSSVIEIRNYFAHSKPLEIVSFHSTALKKGSYEKLESQLRGKFELPHSHSTYLGQGIYTPECAEWALNSVCDFYCWFTKQVKCKPFDI